MHVARRLDAGEYTFFITHDCKGIN
jgi:hypothetical protein